MDHKYIIGFREVYKTRGGKICIVMEHADGGDLNKRINKAKTSRTNIPEETALNWFTQICLGMKHIHDRKIIHRDIKAGNIFLMEKDNSIRLGDFGVARVLDYTVAKAQTQVGTPYYIAPEILKGRAYTNKADVWSMGILLYEICAQDVPIKAANLHDLYKRIMNFKRVPALPRTYSASMKQLIESCLNVDASKRPSIADLLEHEVIKPRIKKLMSDEEVKVEFDHTVLHNDHILRSGGKAQAPPRAPGGVASRQARPYSARSGQSSHSKAEEVKQPSSRLAGAAKGPSVGSDRRAPKPADRSGDSKIGSRAGGGRVVGRGSADKLGAKKSVPSGAQRRSPIKAPTPKFGMGARKNSEGMLHAHKLVPGLNGGARQASPRNKAANFHYNKALPNPSQTPRVNGSKKLAVGGNAAPIGFQKQRPSSAAYGMYNAGSKYQKPLAPNNGRFYR